MTFTFEFSIHSGPFHFFSVKRPKQTSKENADCNTVGKRVPVAPPSDCYRCPASMDTGCSYTSSMSSDCSKMLNCDSNLPIPYRSDARNNMYGVLRVNFANISRDEFVSDISTDSSSSTCSSVLNDLSSVDSSVVSPTVPSMLSFKNI